MYFCGSLDFYFFVDFGLTLGSDEVYSRQDSFQHWTLKKLNLNEKAQGNVWFMLDFPESSKKREPEFRSYRNRRICC